MSCNLRRFAPMILAPALLSSTVLSAHGAEAAPAAAVAPGNGCGAGLRSCLALGALAVAGLAYAGYAWFVPAQDIQAPPPEAPDPGEWPAVAEATYHAVVTPALAAAGQVLAGQALAADIGEAIAGPEVEPAAPAEPEAPAKYFNFMTAPDVKVTPEAIQTFEQARREIQLSVFFLAREARAAMDWDKDWAESAQLMPGPVSAAIHAIQRDRQLNLETSRSIHEMFEALHDAVKWTTPVYLADPMWVRNAPLDLTASLSQVLALEHKLNAIQARFQPTAWTAIARDANSPDLAAHNRENRMRKALQALEEIREGLAPIG